VISNLIAAFRKRRQDRLAVAALSHLTDQQLKDIGLNRFALDHAVRYGVLD
jgi:uncharacterized protein YjiS (DUF1127 family)